MKLRRAQTDWLTGSIHITKRWVDEKQRGNFLRQLFHLSAEMHQSIGHRLKTAVLYWTGPNRQPAAHRGNLRFCNDEADTRVCCGAAQDPQSKTAVTWAEHLKTCCWFGLILLCPKMTPISFFVTFLKTKVRRGGSTLLTLTRRDYIQSQWEDTSCQDLSYVTCVRDCSLNATWLMLWRQSGQ